MVVDPSEALASSLPQPLTPLIGRSREVGEIIALLTRGCVRLITLTGPGGIGKTRLGLRVAAELADGHVDEVAFVPLASIADPGDVPASVAKALGLCDGMGRSLPHRVAAYVQTRSLLLLMDNFEHVSAVAPLLTEMLAAVPRLTLLVTSRVVLRLSAEHVYPVPSLALPPLDGTRSARDVLASEAVQLFVARSVAAHPRFTLDDETAPTVAELCHRLDGLPLALELAAARARVLPPAALLDRIGHRLALLTGGACDQPARLRTMRDAIAWSDGLLLPDERCLFAKLAVFAGGFTIAAAASVAHGGQPKGGTIDGVSTLVDASLVRQAGESADEPRFEMLETIREYGLERLRASGAETTTRDRHATWMLGLVEAAWPPGAVAPTGPVALASLDAERDNVRAALSWLIGRGDAAGALRLTGALAEYWCLRGDLVEGRSWIGRSLALPAGPPRLRSAALYGGGIVADFQGDRAAAIGMGEECLALAYAHGDTLDQLRARFLLSGMTDVVTGSGEVMTNEQSALALARQLGDPGWLCYTVMQMGHAVRRRGGLVLAVDHYEEALRLAMVAGDPWAEMSTALPLASAVDALGDRGRAVRLFMRLIDLSREMASPSSTLRVMLGLATFSASAGHPEVAASLLGAADAMGEQIGLILSPDDRRIHDDVSASTRHHLGEHAFQSALRSGRMAPIDHAFAEATRAAAMLGGAGPLEGVRGLSLTSRELEVLLLVAAGRTNPEIGAVLFISRGTAGTHVSNILAKLGVRSRAEAVDAAHRAGIDFTLPVGRTSI